MLGILGPLRRGGQVEHVGRFSPAAVAEALRRGATMVFGVPTMYHRIALTAQARIKGRNPAAVLAAIVEGVPVPVEDAPIRIASHA